MSNARDYLKKIIVDKNGKEWDECGTTASKNNILKDINWIAPHMEEYARRQVKNLTIHDVLVRFADYLDKTGTCVHGDIDDFIEQDSKMH